MFLYGLVLLVFFVNSSLWVFSVILGLGYFCVYKFCYDYERVYKEILIVFELIYVMLEY